jgi:serine/threonine-protein kinase
MGPDTYEEQIAFLEQYRGTVGAGTALTEQLADLYIRTGRTGDAVSLYEEMVRNGNAAFRTYENLAVLLEQDGWYEEAETLLEQMLESFPARYETYKRLAFLEADRQGMLPQEERDYSGVKEYAELAEGLYGDSSEDTEMNRLRSLLEDLRRSEWLD